MRIAKSALLASTILTTSAFTAQADVNVVASIKPVHSLVAAVMEGVGEPALIVEGAGSPHTYSLKPSQAHDLEHADVVFWIGHELEAFLEKPLEAIATSARTVELIDAHDLTKHAFREGGAFDSHDHGDHDDHGHEEHAEHGHDEHGHDDHGHEEHAEHGHDDHGHEEHDHGEFDPHIWLDPVNAIALVHEIEETLIAADPAHADAYSANVENTIERLNQLAADVSADLSGLGDKPFVVFHDAYQNFEKRFGLSAVGSITVSPEVMPGAERISKLRDKVGDLDAACVFSEPQFEPKLVTTIAEGTNARTRVLDPLGASLDAGPDLYFSLIRGMATSFKTCLGETS